MVYRDTAKASGLGSFLYMMDNKQQGTVANDKYYQI